MRSQRETRCVNGVCICLVLSGRDGLDDTEGVERSLLRHQRGLSPRLSVEDEEADLVLGNVDCAVEADARPLPRQLLGGGTRPPLACHALARGSAWEESLDEVAGHALDATTASERRKRQNV
jgi:hypothetical protein